MPCRASVKRTSRGLIRTEISLFQRSRSGVHRLPRRAMARVHQQPAQAFAKYRRARTALANLAPGCE